MIPNRWRKQISVLQTICNNLEDASPYNEDLLTRYREVLALRRQVYGVVDFCNKVENLAQVFDLLSVWDQHAHHANRADYDLFASTVDRRVHQGEELLETFDRVEQSTTLRDLATFCQGIQECRPGLIALEVASEISPDELRRTAGRVYESLPLAQAHKHIVSNAMLLHLLFPDHLMPVDGRHTLTYLHGRDTVLPANRYMEVIGFQQEILASNLGWETYLDDRWNSTAPKLVDNAIIFLKRRRTMVDRLDA